MKNGCSFVSDRGSSVSNTQPAWFKPPFSCEIRSIICFPSLLASLFFFIFSFSAVSLKEMHYIMNIKWSQLNVLVMRNIWKHFLRVPLSPPMWSGLGLKREISFSLGKLFWKYSGKPNMRAVPLVPQNNHMKSKWKAFVIKCNGSSCCATAWSAYWKLCAEYIYYRLLKVTSWFLIYSWFYNCFILISHRTLDVPHQELTTINRNVHSIEKNTFTHMVS